MNNGFRRWMGGALAAVAVAGALAGCSMRAQRERNALWHQNQELQDELNRSRAAMDTAGPAAPPPPRQAAAPSPPPQQQAPPPPPPEPTRQANRNFAGIQGVQTKMRGTNVEVTVASDILFRPGQAHLTAAAKNTLSQVSDVLKQKYADKSIRVEGYTDTDPIKKSHWQNNQALSEARAKAVAQYLGGHGIDRSRLTTAGFGASHPKDTKAKSRRVELVVMQGGSRGGPTGGQAGGNQPQNQNASSQPPMTKGMGPAKAMGSSEGTGSNGGTGSNEGTGPAAPTKGMGGPSLMK